MSKFEITVTDTDNQKEFKLNFEADNISVIDLVKDDVKTEDDLNTERLDLVKDFIVDMKLSSSLDNMKRAIDFQKQEVKLSEDRQFETKNIEFKIDDVGDDGTFKGYGSIFDNVDSYNDIVKKGAFTKTLNERKNVKMLWQHDSREPIGVFTKVYEDDIGLVVEGKISLDVQRGKEAYALLKMDAIEGLSIGYSTIVSEYDSKTDIRELKELKLYEVSIVTFPANEKSTIDTVKSMDNTSLINNFIKSLHISDKPIENHAATAPVDHLLKKEADSKTDDEKSLEQLLKTLKTKGK